VDARLSAALQEWARMWRTRQSAGAQAELAESGGGRRDRMRDVELDGDRLVALRTAHDARPAQPEPGAEHEPAPASATAIQMITPRVVIGVYLQSKVWGRGCSE
jgi:hypothetical protein